MNDGYFRKNISLYFFSKGNEIENKTKTFSNEDTNIHQNINGFWFFISIDHRSKKVNG